MSGVVVAAAPRPASAPLVTFAGGFMIADGSYRLTLYRNGRGTLQTSRGRHTVVVDQPTLRHLERQLTVADFPELKRDYAHVVIHVRGPAPTGVTYEGTKVTIEPGARVPARLGRLITTLGALVGKLQ